MAQSLSLEAQTSDASAARAQFIAATERAGVIDRSRIGRLRLNGADALDLLNRLSTNNLEALSVGDIQGTVLTTNKGRIIDLLYVLRQEDRLLVLTGPNTRQRVAEWIEFYTFVEDVSVQDVTDDTTMLSLVGCGASEVLPALADIPLYSSATLSIGGFNAVALRTDFAGVDAYDIIAEADSCAALRTALTESGAVPIDAQTLELVRVRSGLAGYGSELGEDYNPLEAGLLHFISFNKGCYIGQEVVARLNAYDKVQKHLIRLSWDAGMPELPAPLLSDGRQVGTLTTALLDLHSGRNVGLGYVRKAHAHDGARLLVANDAVSDADGDIEVAVGKIDW